MLRLGELRGAGILTCGHERSPAPLLTLMAPSTNPGEMTACGEIRMSFEVLKFGRKDVQC